MLQQILYYPLIQRGFALMSGCFMATKRFLERRFHEAARSYMATRLGFSPELFDLTVCDNATT
jgi:hypothetical protein